MNKEKENKNDVSRRKALGLLGKGLTAAAVTGVVLNSNKNVSAQSTNTLDFVIQDYRAFVQSAPQFAWTTQIIVRSPDFNQQCTIRFMKDEQNIPANTVSVDGNSGVLHYPKSRLAEIRDFLRYERPVRLTIVGSNGIATLSNDADEKPGDHDLRLSRLLNNNP